MPAVKRVPVWVSERPGEQGVREVLGDYEHHLIQYATGPRLEWRDTVVFPATFRIAEMEGNILDMIDDDLALRVRIAQVNMVDMMRRAEFSGGRVRGVWEVVKVNRRYGVRYVMPIPEGLTEGDE